MDCNSQGHLSRQEYWSGLPCPLSGDLPDPGIETVSLVSPALASTLFYYCATWMCIYTYVCVCVYVCMFLKY